MRRERDAEEEHRRTQARTRAVEIWHAAPPAADDHPYLISKGISAHGLRVYEGALVIPMRDGADMHSLQFIAADGTKQFLKGGRTRGCYFLVGTPDRVLCIAEGYATGASIYEATGHAVAVAFNAGNLVATARALLATFPSCRLVVCADDDADTGGNPGLTKAREAAQAVHGVAAR